MRFYVTQIAQTLLFAGLLACRPQAKPDADAVKTAPVFQADTSVGFLGTDRARFAGSNGKMSKYEFPEYSVEITPNPEDVGEHIKVLVTKTNRVLNIEMPEAGYFAGLHDHFLLIDAGTGPGARGLWVVDLRTDKKVLDTSYFEYEQPEINSAGELTYLFPLEENQLPKPPACPDKAEWLRNGLSVGYGQRKVFNLNTGRETASGDYACVPLQ